MVPISLVIGVSRQFTYQLSETLPYVYGGALANVEEGNIYLDKITSYTNKIIEYFNIKGLCSVDMLVHEGNVLVLEVNPRVSATYELYEQMVENVNLIDAHLRGM